MSAGRYHRVPETFWQLAREHNWPERTVIVGLYLQTCKHRTTEGLYTLPLAYVAADLGWNVSVVEKQMSQLGKDGFIKYDSKAEVVLLSIALAVQAPKAPGQIEGAIRRLKYLPECPLLLDLYGYASTYSSAFAEAIREAFPVLTQIGTPNGNGSTHPRPLTRTHSTTTTSRTEG